MPARQKYVLRLLTTDERAALERIVRATSARADHQRRATALLAVAAGASLVAAAHQAGWTTGDTVTALITRFPERGLAALDVAPGRGPKPRYDPAARAAVVALVATPPDREHDRTATLLTFFRPATGELRAKGVTRATNAILHPWVQDEVQAILATMGIAQPDPPGTLADQQVWEGWLGKPPWQPLPPLRVILIWDNLAGHHSYSIVRWLYQHGIWPVYTPIDGSWLNMAESIQRIIVRRALAGQHLTSPAQIIDWLEATVRGWNTAPTPLVWGGARQERRSRARQRRLGGSGAIITLAG